MHEDTYDELKELGQLGESFNDTIKRLLILATDSGDSHDRTRTGELPADEVNTYSKAIARLVKENVTSPDGPEHDSDFWAEPIDR